MKRREWFIGTGTVFIGFISGCVASFENDGEKGKINQNNGKEDKSTSKKNQSQEQELGLTRSPDGDGEITVRLELTTGFNAPNEYEVTLNLSHIKLTTAGEETEVLYEIDKTIKLTKASGEYPRFEDTLVDKEEIPVATYDYLQLFGTITSFSTSGKGEVTLSSEDHIEWEIGTVFEEKDHKEHILEIALYEAEQGYEVTAAGVKTLTW